MRKGNDIWQKKEAKLSPMSVHVHLLGTLPAPFLGVILEEIVVQEDGDAQEQAGVDRLLVEYLINVRAAIRQFAGQPGDGFPLFLHLLPDELPDVHAFSCVWMPQTPRNGRCVECMFCRRIKRRDVGICFSAYPVS